MKKRQGVTLVEIIVATFILSLLLTVVIQVMLPALRAWSEGQKRSEVTQGALVTATWLGDDVLRSSPNSMLVNDEGILVMRCASGQQVDHTNDFNQLVAYWREGEDLYRADTVLTTAVSGPANVTLAEVADFDTRRRVASGVTTFDIDLTRPWRLDLDLELQKGGRRAGIQTSFTSMYTPFDTNLAEPTPTPSP